MTWFEKIKLMSIEEFAEWLDEQMGSDISPWNIWWDSTYCQNCESVMSFVPYLNGEHECAWCEINDNKCKFFPEMSKVPNGKEIVRMWLESVTE